MPVDPLPNPAELPPPPQRGPYGRAFSFVLSTAGANPEAVRIVPSDAGGYVMGLGLVLIPTSQAAFVGAIIATQLKPGHTAVAVAGAVVLASFFFLLDLSFLQNRLLGGARAAVAVVSGGVLAVAATAGFFQGEIVEWKRDDLLTESRARAFDRRVDIEQQIDDLERVTDEEALVGDAEYSRLVAARDQAQAAADNLQVAPDCSPLPPGATRRRCLESGDSVNANNLQLRANATNAETALQTYLSGLRTRDDNLRNELTNELALVQTIQRNPLEELRDANNQAVLDDSGEPLIADPEAALNVDDYGPAARITDSVHALNLALHIGIALLLMTFDLSVYVYKRRHHPLSEQISEEWAKTRRAAADAAFEMSAILLLGNQERGRQEDADRTKYEAIQRDRSAELTNAEHARQMLDEQHACELHRRRLDAELEVETAVLAEEVRQRRAQAERKAAARVEAEEQRLQEEHRHRKARQEREESERAAADEQRRNAEERRRRQARAEREAAARAAAEEERRREEDELRRRNAEREAAKRAQDEEQQRRQSAEPTGSNGNGGARTPTSGARRPSPSPRSATREVLTLDEDNIRVFITERNVRPQAGCSTIDFGYLPSPDRGREEVVIKRPLPGLVDMGQREIGWLETLRQAKAQIPTMFGYVRDEGIVVLRFVPRGSLDEALGLLEPTIKTSLTADQLIAILLQELHTTQLTWAKGFCHLDKHPGNYLVTGPASATSFPPTQDVPGVTALPGSILTIDFGLSRPIGDPFDLGTKYSAYYLPPEFKGRSSIVDPFWDVYGVGALAETILSKGGLPSKHPLDFPDPARSAIAELILAWVAEDPGQRVTGFTAGSSHYDDRAYYQRLAEAMQEQLRTLRNRLREMNVLSAPILTAGEPTNLAETYAPSA